MIHPARTECVQVRAGCNNTDADPSLERRRSMAKQEKQGGTATEKKTRVVLTGAEKIAKMEADLAAAREKEQAKAQAKIAGAEEHVASLTKRRDDIQAKLDAATSELEQLKRDAGVDEQPELPAS